MIRLLASIVVAIVAFLLGGCRGDRAADRTLEIHQLQTIDGYSGQFKIDTSQLPPGAIKSREDSGGQGMPVTKLTINQDCPIRIVLVPDTESPSPATNK